MKQQDNSALYHRIYRLNKRDFRPAQIAAALDIPLGTVIKVLKQLEQSKMEVSGHGTHHKHEHGEAVYIVVSDRKLYIMLDIGGSLVLDSLKAFREELQKTLESTDMRPVVLRLTDVRIADSSAIGTITNFHKNMVKKNRKVAFLDPSREVDAIFKELNMYKIIPVYGTEMALMQEFVNVAEEKKRARFVNY